MDGGLIFRIPRSRSGKELHALNRANKHAAIEHALAEWERDEELAAR